MIGALCIWGVHASRVLVSASRQNKLVYRMVPGQDRDSEKFATAGTPSPTRETRALPRVILQR